MPSVQTLMNLGMPSGPARRIGKTPTSKTGVGTAQTGATLLAVEEFGILTTAGGATAFVLPSDAALGDDVVVFNNTATAALLFPHSGGNINNGSTDASISLAQNKKATLTKLTSTLWTSGLTA